MNESMIESCSSPDYTQQEMEMGKDFFFDIAPSSYYKVSLSTEKAKRRQSSMGRRSQATRVYGAESSALESYYTPISGPKNAAFGLYT